MHAFRRELGRSKIRVSALGLGCSPLAGPSWSGTTPLGRGAADDDQSVKALHCAFDYGVNLIDTADSYGAGHSESVIGQAIAGRRDRLIVMTKFGNTFDEAQRRLTGRSTDPSYVRAACEASLRRLGTDYIDVYLFHYNDCPLAAAPPVREVLEQLTREGKIRCFGWSTDYPDRAEAFAESPHCAVIQYQMNVLDDAPAMVATCERLGLAGVNRGPLAMGLLTAKYSLGDTLAADDVRGVGAPSWMTYFKEGKPNPTWVARRDAVAEILRQGGRSLAQGALAWLWARSACTVPIPGFKTVEQVMDNCGALDRGPLDDQQMHQIDELLARRA